MLPPKHTSKRVLSATLALFILLSPTSIFAALKPTNSNECANILLVYLRGSGQNQNDELVDDPLNPDFQDVEKESYAFFSQFKQHIDADFPHVDYKAVSIHDFPGKYDTVGYKAVPVGIPGQVPNTANAETSWLPGNYRESVDHGINETVGYLKDQMANCPDQLIAVGGYSQGAQVMGESLFRLTDLERSKIVGVGLFGDPKFIASTGDNIINPFDHHTSYPWRRGDATNNDRGMLDARLPYVPTDMEKRVASYCYRADLVCAGWSGLRGLKDVAHGGYAGTATNNTVNEIMQWAAPKLSQIERQKGGSIIPDDESLAGMYPDAKARDIMFLLNDDSNASVIDTFRYRLDKRLYPITLIHPDTTYGMKALEEADYVPHYSTVQSLLPYVGYDASNPMFSVSNLQTAINKRYPFGIPYFGSGDQANPIGYAVEKAAFSTNWRSNTTRNLVVFTDRPLKDNYTYGFCGGNIQQAPQGGSTIPCTSTAIDTTPQPKTLFPEICKTAFQAVSQDTCSVASASPNTVKTVTRTLEDEIAIAQSQNVAVSVVVPLNVRPRYSTQQSYDTAMGQLEYFAKSTGGKLIYYDKTTSYNEVLLTDTLYQIFGHTPKPLVLAYKDALDSQGSFQAGHVLGASTNQPIILDVSQSNTPYSQYKWDFNDDGQWDETSSGPVIQHQFTAPQTGFVRMAGTNESGTVLTETKLAVDVSQSTQTSALELPTAPQVTATLKTDGDIVLNWEPSEGGDLMVIDPESHLPVAQASLVDGTLTFTPEQPYQQLEIRVVTTDAISDTQTVTVEQEVIIPVLDDPIPPEEPPIVVTDPDPTIPPEETSPPVQEEPDPTICYKLQQCQNESAPPEAYNPQQVESVNYASVPQTKTNTATDVSVSPIQQNADQPLSAQPAVQGATTEPTILPDANSQIDQTLNEAKITHTNHYLQWTGLSIFILGGFLLICRLRQGR